MAQCFKTSSLKVLATTVRTPATSPFLSSGSNGFVADLGLLWAHCQHFVRSAPSIRWHIRHGHAPRSSCCFRTCSAVIASWEIDISRSATFTPATSDSWNILKPACGQSANGPLTSRLPLASSCGKQIFLASCTSYICSPLRYTASVPITQSTTMVTCSQQSDLSTRLLEVHWRKLLSICIVSHTFMFVSSCSVASSSPSSSGGMISTRCSGIDGFPVTFMCR